MALKRIAIPSPNYSGRGGSGVRLIVLHTAEGATNFRDLGAYFAQRSAEVSSHVGIDDNGANEIGEYVRRPDKAWTAGNANPYSIQVELCGFAKWTTSEWDRHPNMLNSCALWIAEEAAHYALPLTRLTASQAQGGGRGVCQHVDLSGPGGHWDCGSGLPMNRLLDMARGVPAPSPPSTPSGQAPAFPFPSDHYLGTTRPDPKCHSGAAGGKDDDAVRQWQQKMQQRHWIISVDGLFGPQSEDCARQFQKNKHLSVDGLVGPATWSATWTTPVGG